ncbi:helix-turn-helix transcriptional regulator [Pseudomonas nicosulfuronedens]|uniref:Helix-turn-helix transcriptional regulator n=2 Tax=Pseudomonas TaxID=286 RepID=A0A5R9QKZ7_9PSED|nr:helix-turn-helix transcriptional regulator [Pseudomonas nicosulfuronedens]
MTMNQSSPPDELSPQQVRAARALLAWSQQELAKNAGVATSTVADFERGHRTPMANNAAAIRNALERAGISFPPQGAVIGPALPPIAPPASVAPSGIPLRWVTSQDLTDWANRTDAAGSMSTLLSHLVYASEGAGIWRRFPAEESVRHSGWDGVTSGEARSRYVPPGETGWEITTQRMDIAGKATSDYRKRTENPDPLDPSTSTYVFISTRPWPKKHEWVNERNKEGVWKDVRAYDADDLVHWIEQTPSVGLWLARRLNKRPDGVHELSEVWEEWSLASIQPLSEELVLSDRDQDAIETLRWLRGVPSMLSLQASTTEEVVAFFHATLSMLPNELSMAYRARSLVAATTKAARDLAVAPAPLIMLLMEPDPGLAKVLVGRGHYVLQCYDDRQVTQGDLRVLERPSREGIIFALTQAGVPEAKADALARDCARNLTVLRRLMFAAPGRRPRWADTSPSPVLRAALLAGGWDESSEADCARIAEIADLPYDKLVVELASFAGNFDSPLQKVASAWRVRSPIDAWMLLSKSLSSVELARFENVALQVLEAEDPRFGMAPDERWLASLQDIRPSYSELLRHGVGKTLILLALWGDTAEAKRSADQIVRKLMGNADQVRWWSLSKDFRLLAEASPQAFLDALEDSLEQEDQPLGSLFTIEDGIGAGASHLCDLLWALESLAWSPEHLARVARVLAKLDSIDTTPARYMNRPSNSLRNVFLLWGPQTYATLEQRLKILDVLRKRESESAWRLMLGMLPKGNDTSTPSPSPRWRDFTPERVEEVSWSLISRGVVEITQRLIADAGRSALRWKDLVDRLPDLVSGPGDVLGALEVAEREISDEEGRTALWGAIRRTLHHHRQFHDMDWAMPEDTLARLEMIYERFTPKDEIQSLNWLFAGGVSVPRPSSGWEAEERDIDELRRRAVNELVQTGGPEAVLELARQVEHPMLVGKALFQTDNPEPVVQAVVEAALLSGDSRQREVARGYIAPRFHQKGKEWAEALLKKARTSNWNPSSILAILLSLPGNAWTWEQAHHAGTAIEESYWKSVPVFWSKEHKDEVIFAIKKFVSVSRARAAVAFAGRDTGLQLETELLVDLLNRAALESAEPSADPNDGTMFQHYVGEIFQCLDKRDDLDKNALALLEWKYLQVLEHSRRPPKAILVALAEQPALFVLMLSAAFSPSEESNQETAQQEDRNASVASQAYRLLRLWSHLPGTREDGSIDHDALIKWVDEVIVLAEARHRKDIAYDQIGAILSASPMGADGNWPAEPVREVIDELRNKTLLNGFYAGKVSRRGGTTRLLSAGGALERTEVEKYRRWAQSVALEHPFTARALEWLAERYEAEARFHDDDAERRDWF